MTLSSFFLSSQAAKRHPSFPKHLALYKDHTNPETEHWLQQHTRKLQFIREKHAYTYSCLCLCWLSSPVSNLCVNKECKAGPEEEAAGQRLPHSLAVAHCSCTEETEATLWCQTLHHRQQNTTANAHTQKTPLPQKACSNERLVEPPQRDVRQRKMHTYSLQPHCAEQAGFWPEMKCNAKTVEPIIKDHPDVEVTTPCSRSLFMQKAETEQGRSARAESTHKGVN